MSSGKLQVIQPSHYLGLIFDLTILPMLSLLTVIIVFWSGFGQVVI